MSRMLVALKIINASEARNFLYLNKDSKNVDLGQISFTDNKRFF